MSAIELFGTTFQNPVLLASGTAGFGREVHGVIDLDALGGIVTKAVTPEPRVGHPPPRVAEFRGGMLNAVGLANPGLASVIAHELPWLVGTLRRARIIVNVAGAVVDDYIRVIEQLAHVDGITAFEVNASCPNTAQGGLEFAQSTRALAELVRHCRRVALPVIGVGGIRTAADAREYLEAGASLVAIGTAALADPRVPERVARALARG